MASQSKKRIIPSWVPSTSVAKKQEYVLVTPESGIYSDAIECTLTASDPTATIFYILNLFRDANSNDTPYTAPITISTDTILSGVAYFSNTTIYFIKRWSIKEPPTATLVSGVPASLNNASSVTIVVGGDEVTEYIYKFDSGAWSSVIQVATPISISSELLTDGAHTLYVRGKNALSQLQRIDAITTAGWTTDRTAPVTSIVYPVV